LEYYETLKRYFTQKCKLYHYSPSCCSKPD